MSYLMLAAYGNATRRVPLASSGCTNPQNLASAVIGKKASFPTGASVLDFAIPGATTVRALALNGLVNTASGTHTAKFDLSANTPGGTDILTTTKTLSTVDGYGGLCCWDLGQDYTGVRYVRVTFTGVSEVGLVWASPAWAMTYGPTSYNEKRSDLSTVTTGELSGVKTFAKRPRQRVASFALDAVMLTEYSAADTLDLVSGTTEQVLVIWDPPGQGVSRAPIMGTMDEVPTMTLPDPARWTTAWSVTQSL
ncbi:hypothetical protein [Azospirillum himalayense]|uniref:Uncharacterized protein n=1 Tax=Azospirillum himalayense TaxID=654847 RepID=A0ABW0FZY4_9PROT